MDLTPDFSYISLNLFSIVLCDKDSLLATIFEVIGCKMKKIISSSFSLNRAVGGVSVNTEGVRRPIYWEREIKFNLLAFVNVPIHSPTLL